MCGIVGFVVSAPGARWTEQGDKLKEYMYQMLYFDAARGPHATGLMRIDRGKHNELPSAFKRAWHAADFLGHKQADALLNNVGSASAMIGHNRFATYGGKDAHGNAHPFNLEHITLVHNGHVTNARELVSHESHHEVDSAMVTAAIAIDGAEAVLPKLDGGYSLVWHNAKDGTINFARNDKRPMYMRKLGSKDVPWGGIVFASEMEMLHLAISRIGIPTHDLYFQPKPWTWHKIPLDDPSKIQFAAYEKPVVEVGHKVPFSGTTSGQQDTAGGAVTDIRSKRFKKRSYNSVDMDKQSKRLWKGPAIKRDTVLEFRATSFIPYRNRPEHGVIRGVCPSNSSWLLEMDEVPKTMFDTLTAHDSWGYSAQALDYIAGHKTTAEVVKCVPHINLRQWVSMVKGEKESDNSRESEQEGPFLCGPAGTRIKEDTWISLTNDGCGSCGGFISPALHARVRWVESSPVCPECAADTDAGLLKSLQSKRGHTLQ
jgi:hypothetical protein